MLGRKHTNQFLSWRGDFLQNHGPRKSHMSYTPNPLSICMLFLLLARPQYFLRITVYSTQRRKQTIFVLIYGTLNCLYSTWFEFVISAIHEINIFNKFCWLPCLFTNELTTKLSSFDSQPLQNHIRASNLPGIQHYSSCSPLGLTLTKGSPEFSRQGAKFPTKGLDYSFIKTCAW